MKPKGRTALKRHMLLIGVVILTSLAVTPGYPQDRAVPGGNARSVFNFPRDHRMHQDDPLMNQHYMEWLYFTGIVQDETSGAVWGYEITLWQSIIPILNKNKPLFAYDIALSDLQHSRHYAYRMVPVRLGPKRLGEIRQEGDTWVYEQPGGLTIRHQETADIWNLAFTSDSAADQADQPPLQLVIKLVNDKSDYYTHSADGLIASGNCSLLNRAALDGYTYYYTNPALTTTATLTIDQQTITLRGDTWFDHQWGNFNHCLLKWNWLSLRLDEGRYLMVFQFVDSQGNPLPDLLSLSVIDPARGQQQFWTGSDALSLIPLRTWTDTTTRIRFPLAWELTTPVGTFGIEPAFDDQMMPPLPKPYWEGVIVVRQGGVDGHQIGNGYLEVAR
jgi:predicted secreted hydrolase